jgi:erythronate-4-phosphate dehydrogenase
MDKKLKIVVDENIPHGREAFSTVGEVVSLPGRAITSRDLADAQALVVRSITKVNAALLKNSPVEFVGTCTIGTDHVDLEYLRSKNVYFTFAPGCNSRSVMEYLTAVLLHLSARYRVPLANRTLGVVGAGNIGGRLAGLAKVLGMKVLLNDPPRAEAEKSSAFCGLDIILKNSDFITLHVPLTAGGPHPTHHLINGEKLAALSGHQYLINTCRGPVVDNRALLEALEQKKIGAAVLDVWENEPDLSIKLLEKAAIGTPHIAGYSFDGKVNGARTIYKALCNHFQVKSPYGFPEISPLPLRDLSVGTDKGTPEEQMGRITRLFYDPLQDDRNLRTLAALPESGRGAAFDLLRKNYRVRREFKNVTLHFKSPADPRSATAAGLGFKVVYS